MGELDENPFSQPPQSHGRETVGRAIGIADAGEVRRAFELALERIGPAVIRASELTRGAGGLSDNCGGMVAQTLKNPRTTSSSPLTTKQYPANLPCDVLARIADLICAPNKLPGAREDHPPLQFENAWI